MPNAIENWILHVALQKGLKRVVQVAVAFILAHIAEPAVVGVLKTLGLTVNVDSATLTAGLTTFATGGLEVLRNFLKSKLNFKWL